MLPILDQLKDPNFGRGLFDLFSLLILSACYLFSILAAIALLLIACVVAFNLIMLAEPYVVRFGRELFAPEVDKSGEPIRPMVSSLLDLLLWRRWW